MFISEAKWFLANASKYATRPIRHTSTTVSEIERRVENQAASKLARGSYSLEDAASCAPACESRTVSTGHGAVRTTCSATLPINR